MIKQNIKIDTKKKMQMYEFKNIKYRLKNIKKKQSKDAGPIEIGPA